jgi:hypothetical protein
MAKNLSASEYTDKLIRNMTNAVPDWERGIANVTESPTAKAAAKSDKWLSKIQQSKEKFERGLKRITKEAWQEVTLSKGRDRIAQGVEAARSKIEAFAADFLPFQESVRKEVAAMPDTTLEQNIARATAMMKGTAKYVRKA